MRLASNYRKYILDILMNNLKQDQLHIDKISWKSKHKQWLSNKAGNARIKFHSDLWKSRLYQAERIYQQSYSWLHEMHDKKSIKSVIMLEKLD